MSAAEARVVAGFLRIRVRARLTAGWDWVAAMPRVGVGAAAGPEA